MSSSGKRPQRPPPEAQQGLLTSVQYTNHLPDIPFPSKFLPYPFDPVRFIQYAPTSLERDYKHKLIAPTNVGVEVDLIDDAAFATPPGARLHQKDSDLLKDETEEGLEDKRAKLLALNLPWLRKTEYSTPSVRLFGMSAKALTENLINTGAVSGTNRANDRASQVDAIEKTFEEARKLPQHPRKKHLEPVEILPLFPDTKLWCYDFSQGVFDSSPAPKGLSDPEQRVDADDVPQQVSQALLVGRRDEETKDDYVEYFLPCRDTMLTRKWRRQNQSDSDLKDGDQLKFFKLREYNYAVKQGLASDDNYFIVFRKGEGAFYNELRSKIRLTKRLKLNPRTGKHVRWRRSNLVVSHRPWTEEELAAQDERLAGLTAMDDQEAMDDAGVQEQASEAPAAAAAVASGDDNTAAD